MLKNEYYINKIRQDTHVNQTNIPTYLPTYLRISIINNSNINNNNYNNNNDNNYNNNNNKNYYNNGRNNSQAKQLTGETTHLIRAKRPTHKTRAKRPTGETTHGRNGPDSIDIDLYEKKINLVLFGLENPLCLDPEVRPSMKCLFFLILNVGISQIKKSFIFWG